MGQIVRMIDHNIVGTEATGRIWFDMVVMMIVGWMMRWIMADGRFATVVARIGALCGRWISGCCRIFKSLPGIFEFLTGQLFVG